MFDQWGRRVEWPEASSVESNSAGERLAVRVGDEQRCRDLLSAAANEIRTIVQGRRGLEMFVGEPRGSEAPETVPLWSGRPCLFEEYYDRAGSAGRRRLERRTLGLTIGVYGRAGRLPMGPRYRRALLTVARDGIVQLGCVPATPENVRKWLADGKADQPRGYDADDLFGGQPISSAGDGKRSRELLARTTEELKAPIEACEEIWLGNGPRWMGPDLRAKLSVDRRPTPNRNGMIPRWTGSPRLCEEIYWDEDPVEWTWSRSRYTPAFEVRVELPSGANSRERKSWTTTLTVSADGVVELGSVPATAENLQKWFARCVAQMPAVVPPPEPDRLREDGWIISRSSGAALMRCRSKLLEARQLLAREIELRSVQGSGGSPKLRETVGTSEQPGLIGIWDGTPRMFEETYWCLDMDGREPWIECTRTLGYRWECFTPRGAITIVMTVDAEGEAELHCGATFTTSGAGSPVTVEAFRAILDQRGSAR